MRIAPLLFGCLAALQCAAQDTVEHPPRPDRMGVTNTGPYDYGAMGPAASPAIVEAAAGMVTKPLPAGPFAPTWDSLQKNYRTPTWFEDAKFGIFMHWGVFSAAAHHNEWYEKHMYNADAAWHAEHFGPQEKFGYKDLIPLFTAAKWDPDAWAALFKKSGARMVMEMGEHHDNFALWDSAVTPFNAKKMGPHRDLVGDLAAAVRSQGMRVAISNHGVENFTFIAPTHDVRVRLEAAHADLFDPAWAAFYNVADRSDAAMTRFLADWVNRNDELIDRYQPDMLWFDNGANLRVLDPLKLRIAAYYYNRARTWGKEVSLGTKFNAYAPTNDDTKQIGSILDFEKVGTRSPAGIRPGPWMVDDTLGNSWGYIDGLRIASAESILGKLIDTVSKGGFYMLNISPMADGVIPRDQQDVLLKIGGWLDVNGEAIYATRPWAQFSEAGATAWHFTSRGNVVYAITSAWPGTEALVASFTGDKARVTGVQMLGSTVPLRFTQTAAGLKIVMPADHPAGMAWAFRIATAQAFDVASIKPSIPPFRGVGITGGPGSSDPARVRFANFSLNNLIAHAYAVEDYRISGPAWCGETRFAITATMPADTSKEQFRGMLQNLLAERFQLKVHDEEKNLSMYSLVAAKGGVKFSAAKTGAETGKSGMGIGSSNGHDQAQLQAHNEPISWLTRMLSGQLGTTVVDDTGLTGNYDFSMQWVPQPPGSLPPENEDAGPSLFSALQEQLGLKLVAGKGPTRIIVIDSASKTPTEN